KASAAEKQVAAKLRKASAFYLFLWDIRDELFSPEFQDELVRSYQPRGQEPCPPALLAMVMLLQRYDGLSDADAVDAAENDRRWQLVLGTLGSDQAPFGQGTLVRFRMRAISNDLDKRLVERTVELAKKTGGFGWKQLRVALDSSPLHGAGRVEDTWNLIGRAMSKVVHAVSLALAVDEETVIQSAGLSVLTADSIKAALDVDWNDEDAQLAGLQKLLSQVDALERWVARRATKQAEVPPLKDSLDLLRRLVDQDIEPDPSGDGRRLKQEVAKERVISVADPEMRHGRKSKSKLFNGYKRHIATANNLILATAVEPANVREHEPAERLLTAVAEHGDIEILDIDRGYLPSPAVEALHQAGTVINSRPWAPTNKGLFTKDDFRIDARRRQVTCPNGKTATATDSGKASFSVEDCSRCTLKSACTTSESRSITLHPMEDLLVQLRRRNATRPGRAQLRKRDVVEHQLARIGATQGDTARYFGARKNELDLNRSAAIVNLHEVARRRAG
ncbi:MAG TPA: IS1182 family transposase, partial [Polyangiaceae bacterium]|nr:IS1182 family transposase [Polyangiaceae bacterium]